MAQKSYKLLQKNNQSFKNTIDRMNINTVTFENHSYAEIYQNSDVKYMENTVKNLVYYRNIILEKYIKIIKETAIRKSISEETMKKYELDPYRCSLDETGYVDFWWIILAINECLNVTEFKDLTTILIPDIYKIAELLTEELANPNAENFGKLV